MLLQFPANLIDDYQYFWSHQYIVVNSEDRRQLTFIYGDQDATRIPLYYVNDSGVDWNYELAADFHSLGFRLFIDKVEYLCYEPEHGFLFK
jgi:hypothetical protein